jgi:3-carboxy-cis,cis-muconate cycloisomerase
VSVSPFDHPYLSGLLGDEEVGACFSVQAELAAMLLFERALAEAEAEEGVIPSEAAEAIAGALGDPHIDIDALKVGTARDGVVVPELVSQLRALVGEPHGHHVHFGSTSQDVIDTGLSLRLARALAILSGRLDMVIERLTELETRDGASEVMAHTRMQAALPVPAARKIRSWREPLVRHRDRITALENEVAVLHFGGAVGTLDRLGAKGVGVARRMASRLGLRTVIRARHSERDGQAALANWLSMVSGALGKMGQDIALMAQTEVGEIKLASGGGSSAMPHKVNPVGAEVLVALARFNATLLSGMHHSLVHENERSGAAWTLEWMLLPQMTVATGAALRIAGELVEGLSFTARPAAS